MDKMGTYLFKELILDIESKINLYECEKFLKNNRKVMFSGTPCQVAALKHYLQHDYDNLLTVDIICHGVPSPKVWNLYLDELCGISTHNYHQRSMGIFR